MIWYLTGFYLEKTYWVALLLKWTNKVYRILFLTNQRKLNLKSKISLHSDWFDNYLYIYKDQDQTEVQLRLLATFFGWKYMTEPKSNPRKKGLVDGGKTQGW